MFLFSLTPILSWALLVYILFTQTYDQGPYTKLRIALLTATIIHSLIVVAITETLNAFWKITFTTVSLSWTVVLLSLTGFAYLRGAGFTRVKELCAAVIAIRRLGWKIALILFILTISLFLALIYPPNNFDSMTYHMARVAHWMQNESISHYQTHIVRQLVYPPFAEWLLLHFQILSKSDVLANSVQLFYFALSISTVSLITKALGGSARQQLTSALLTALIPMAIIQSNTTQNDIVAAFYVLCFGYYTLRITQNTSPRLVLLAGITLGLACLTKGTSYIYAIPFVLWYLIILAKDYQQPLKLIIKRALIFSLIPIIALIINTGFFYRNLFLNGSILGNANKDTGNQGMNPKQLAFVAIKNFMNHLPVTGEMKIKVTEKAAAAGIDINDPEYNFVPIAMMYEGFCYHEDYMQNYIYVILIILTSIYFLFKKDLYNSRINYYVLFVGTITAMPVLFTILLKWQPWANRLQTTLFMFYCCFLGMEIGKLHTAIRTIVLVPILYYSYGALFKSANHPFPFSKTIYKAPFDSSVIPNATRELSIYLDTKPYTKLGIYIGADSWDYPYFRSLSLNNNKPRILKHLFVNNESTIYFDNFVPDAIVSSEPGRDKYTINGIDYVRTRTFRDAIAVFEKK